MRNPTVARPMRAARSLAFRKQRRILDWLGFPATESMRRILSRIVPASLSVQYLLYLRGSLAEPGVMDCLRHNERINAGALELLTSRTWRRYVTPRLIADVGREEIHDAPSPQVVRLLADTVNMAEVVGWRRCPRKFVSLDRLKAIHDELLEAFNEPVGEGMRAAIFRELFFSGRGEERAGIDFGLPLHA